MLTLKMIEGVHAFKRSWGVPDGACFGVTDPSRLRAPISEVLPEPVVPKEEQKKRVPAMRVIKKKKK